MHFRCLSVTNDEVRARTGQQSIKKILDKIQHWFGHMIRMDHKRVAQQLGDFGSRTDWKGTVMKDLHYIDLHLSGKRSRQRPFSDKTASECGPSTWMPIESEV